MRSGIEPWENTPPDVSTIRGDGGGRLSGPIPRRLTWDDDNQLRLTILALRIMIQQGYAAQGREPYISSGVLSRVATTSASFSADTIWRKKQER